jgi:hypothetical protein
MHLRICWPSFLARPSQRLCYQPSSLLAANWQLSQWRRLQGPQPGQQLLDREGFLQVVVGTGIQGFHPVFDAVHASEHRQGPIEQQQIPGLRADQLQLQIAAQERALAMGGS